MAKRFARIAPEDDLKDEDMVESLVELLEANAQALVLLNEAQEQKRGQCEKLTVFNCLNTEGCAWKPEEGCVKREPVTTPSSFFAVMHALWYPLLSQQRQ